ncbi:hypothetical protein ACJJIQ_09610 [Microbulbifer sp. ANSA003]|uniref:hypothetical protein n=1 Tax=unclassified Microbulbifer TaxID=2619833 RepID=UPI00403990CA
MRKYVIDFSALLVACIALGLTIWQGRTQIEHNHITLEPRINSYFSNNSKEGQWGIYLVNNGMGTGFVSDLIVLVDGVEVPENERGKFFSALIALNLNPLCFMVGAPRPNDSIQVGDEKFIVEATEEGLLIPQSCPRERLRLMEYQRNRLDYILKIKSIYGDEFMYQYSKNEQVRI